MNLRNTMQSWIGAGVALWLAGSAGNAGAAADLPSELRALRTQLEALGDRTIPPELWQRTVDALHDLAQRAERAGDTATLAGECVAEARAWADMRHDPRQALRLLRETRARGGIRSSEDLRRFYVLEAEMLSKLGDSDAIRRLIVEFKSSPIYDREPFTYTAGEGRDTPLTVLRPFAKGTDSRTLLAMQGFLEQARNSAGAMFPNFAARDLDGKDYSAGSLQGHVALVDLWVSGSVPWTRNLPFVVRAHEKFGSQGFVVLGVCQNLDADGVRDFVRGHSGMGWPQVPAPGARALGAKLGVFGECSSYLLDRQGRIRGRNLEGSALIETVRRLMDEP